MHLNVVVSVAMLILLALELMRARRLGEWNDFWLELLGMAAFAVFLYFLVGFPLPADQATGKGSPEDDITLVVLLACCMVLGMLAQSFYRHFSLPLKIRKGRKFDWGLFLAPVCASPIVFIPLMITLQNANIDLKQLTIPRLMIFFVAFQNGFFWKEHFDRKRREIEKGQS